MGFHTVRTGQTAAIWSKSGSMQLVEGPTRVFTLFKKFEALRTFSASQTEYLVVTHTTGLVEHVAGPVTMVRHPIEHKSINILPAEEITSHEALVVYARSPDTEKVQRKIVRGPCVYFPGSNEWLHHFQWHGTKDRKGHIVPKANKFHKLKLIADQLYYNVQDVRTRDDALIVVKVMIFYRLFDAEMMLDNTDDPVADFVNASCADIISHTAARSYEEFVSSTHELNDLATYPQLISRARSIGYEVTKIVYRGYHASDALQLMHNEAIQERTRLRLVAETETQEQELMDLRQGKQLERDLQSRATEEEATLHRNRMEALTHDEVQRQKQANWDVELQKVEKENAARVQMLRDMKELGVDLTAYLVAQTPQPDKFIKIDHGQAGGSAQVHLHQQMGDN